MLMNLALQALMLLGPALLALLGYGVVKLNQLIAAKVKNEAIKGILSRLDQAALDAVKSVYQSYVEPLKAAGALDDAAKAKAKAAALENIKGFMGEKGIKEAMKVLGLEGDKMDDALANKVEAVIADQKK